MFLDGIIRRRLLSSLSPWLRDPPEVEVKVGIVWSHAIAKNLRFDAAVLNGVLGDSAVFVLKELTVGEFSVRFSNWSVHSLAVEVRDVNVVLSVRELEQGGAIHVQNSKDTELANLVKKLSAVDPEGTALHEALRKFSGVKPSIGIKGSILNLIYRHCLLEIHDMKLQLQFPMFNDGMTWVSEVRELTIFSEHLEQGCLLRDAISTTIRPLRKSSFVMNLGGLDIGFKRDAQMITILYCRHLLSYALLKDLQFVDFNLHVPELKISSSPLDIAVSLLCREVLVRQVKQPRHGKLLWKITASKISSLTSGPKGTLYRLITDVILWLRYLRLYEDLLSLVGYPSIHILKRSVLRASEDKTFMGMVRHRLERISDMERELRPDAIVRARRIGRYRISQESSVQIVTNCNSCSKFLYSILALLTFFIRAMCKVLKYILSLDVSGTHLHQEQGNHGSFEGLAEESHIVSNFSLNIERVLVTLSTNTNKRPSFTDNMESQSGVSDNHLFRLAIGAISVKYNDNILEQSLLLSCGKLSVSAIVIGSEPASGSSSSSETHGARGDEDNVTSWGTIIWNEPLAYYGSSVTNDENGSPAFVVGCSYLQKFLGEMCLKWQANCPKFEETDAVSKDNTFVLFQIKSYLIYPEPSCSTPGFLKCNLMVGKLNIELGSSSTKSIALLFRQMDHAFCWVQDRKHNLQSAHPGASEDQSDFRWNMKYRSYFGDVKGALIEILPQKHIELGAFIGGPRVRISFQNDGLIMGKNINYPRRSDFQLTLELHDIEIALWPTSESDLDRLTKCNKTSDSESKKVMLAEHHKLDIAAANDEKYISQMQILLGIYIRASGFTAYVEKSRMKQKMQIFALNPLTVQLSSFREYVHSFSRTTIALSADFHGVASGFLAHLFTDEIHIIIQAVTDLLNQTMLYLETVPIGFMSLQESLLKNLAHADLQNEDHAVNESTFLDKATFVLIKGVFNLYQMDIILQKSRSSKGLGGLIKRFDAAPARIDGHSTLDSGIGIALKQASIKISCEDRKMEVLLDLPKFQSSIFRYESKARAAFYSPLEVLEMCSLNSVYEMSFSNLTVTLCWGSPQQGTTSSEVDGTSSISNCTTETERSSRQSSQIDNFPDVMASFLSHWLLINLSIGEILLMKNSVKDMLLGAHGMSKLTMSLSVEGEFQKVSLGIQGGCLLIEMTALAAYVGLYASYVRCFQDLLRSVESSYKISGKTGSGSSTATLNGNAAEDNVQELLHSSDQNGSQHMKAFTLKMSQFTLVFAAEEKSGLVREIIQEVDMNLNFEIGNERRKILFDLLRLSVTSQVLHPNANDDIHVPRFSSVTSRRSVPSTSSGNLAGTSEQQERTDAIDNASSLRDSSEDSSTISVVHLGHRKFILKHCCAFVHAYTIDNCPPSFGGALVGGGSISGVDITISLSDLEMIFSAFGSLPGVSSTGTTNESRPSQLSNHPDIVKTFEEMIPNGAIVAMQDVDQHMYFAIDGEKDKHSLVGVFHYSLVGERAFFKVNYQNEGGRRSSNQWFSLISLYAKDESGQPLRLTYRRGSGFVEVSSSCDSSSSLFRAVSCKPERFKGDDVGWEAYNQLVKGTFYVLNKRNDSAVAFVNGIPEFVRKPGNPFKLKVFQETDLPRFSILPISFSSEASSRTVLQQDEHIAKEMSGRGQYFPRINIKVEKVSLTIVHELDDDDMFPLLQSSIDNTQLIVQTLRAKVKVICTMTTWLDFFDSQGNSWRHLVDPVELYSFGRNRFLVDNRHTVKHGAPLYFYCKTKELDLSLTEVSLDILLFVIGKLNIAGPFSVRSARIIPNCCKVQNLSGATLLCHLYGKRTVKIPRADSAYIQLKHSVLANQATDISPAVSIQLGFPGSFATSLVHLSLSESQTFAWRTRILSLDGSRTYPGPFLVVDIVRKAEDGLLIMVSPSIRVHNETSFSMELRFQRPLQEKDEFALVLLNKGETLDDSMAMFDATNLSGGLKKAITSLTLGNFLFSFRPEIPKDLFDAGSSLSIEWSDDIRGGKAVRVSGVLDKLSYKVRRALSSESIKTSFTTACCTVNSSNSCMSKLHFLIQSCTRDVPIRQPDAGSEQPLVSIQEQKEIFLLPTVRISNFLQSEINVVLTDSEQVATSGCHCIGNQATISCGSTADFYANPSQIYFNVTLTAFNSSCKPLNSGDWMKKLLKNRKDVNVLDMDLDFGGGKYFASLRLSRGRSGILEASIFTPYALRNSSGFPLYIRSPNQKPPSRDEMQKLRVNISPDMGLYLPPDSSGSWFMKSTKLQIQVLEDNICEAVLDLNSLSGLSEVRLEMDKGMKNKYFTKFGIAVGPAFREVPARLVTMVPRYVVVNNSDKDIMVRQCYLEDDMAGIITTRSGQRAALVLRDTINRSELSLFENFIRKHRNSNDDTVTYVQFQLSGSDFGWSGPVCVASLGRFFLKFRKQQPNLGTMSNQIAAEFASLSVVEEGSSLIMHFHKPPTGKLPYRIENHLHDAIITFYQKDSSEPEILQPDNCSDYVWDDLTLPHKLVVQISDIHNLREINLDKVREWKPFFKVGRYEGLSSHVLQDKKLRNDKSKVGGLKDLMEVGYEVYADGPTRVLRISETSNKQGIDKRFQSCGKIRLRIPHLMIHMLELKEVDGSEPSGDTQILISRLSCINIDALFADHQKYSQISVQSLNVVPRWVGAPFAALLRRHDLDDDYPNDCILKSVVILQSTTSTVRQVKYLSIVLQPVDLNLDEETLMKLVPFWRSSLSESRTPSQQYYFDHFEVHPIKIFVNFLPGDSYSNYSSAQETLRSFIHSVVKIPPMRNKVVELNGVLVTHALVTIRELSVRCAQHYTWYAMRAIYIAKGSPLLPPGFASIFDDLASSSLDVFFDPSHGLMKLPGITKGTFKLLSKSIGGKGFSGTKRYFGDLGKTLKSAGSNVLFAAVTEVSDSVLKGAETSGFDGMVKGFHQGILKLAMEPSVLGSALLEGGPDRVIKLDKSPGLDELYVEGYLQAMLDSIYKQEYLRVRVIDNQVILKNLPPNSSLIEEIMDRVREFLMSKALIKGDPSMTSRPLRHLRGESEWRFGPTVMTLCEHLFVSFAIRMLRNQAGKAAAKIKWKREPKDESRGKDDGSAGPSDAVQPKVRFIWKWGIGQFVLSGVLAYVDGRLCRAIPNPVARRIVSGFLLSFLDKSNEK